MSHPKPPLSNRELLTFTDAYRIVWDAAAMAMDTMDPTSSNVHEMKAIQSEEIGLMFDKLDQCRNLGFKTITLGNLVEPLGDQIKVIQEQRKIATGDTRVSSGNEDNRTLALMGLDIYVRWAKDELSNPA